MVLPSAVAFILFGDWIVALLFQRGDFLAEDTAIIHGTLAAYSVGLLAAASVKLFASGFHAMLDTRTPVTPGHPCATPSSASWSRWRSPHR
jgi:putative peptidoglycan lipid II flippase